VSSSKREYRTEPPRGASEQRRLLRDRLRSWFDHHRSTAFISWHRLLAEPLQTLMTSLVIAIALALPASLYVAIENLQQISGGIDTSARISLFLQPSTREAAIQPLREQLLTMPEIASVTYISRQQALDEFRVLSGLGDVLEALDDNPLPPVLLLQPTESLHRNFSTANQLVEALQQLPQVDDVRLDMKWLQRLSGILEIGRRLAAGLGIALGLGVLLVVGNTISLAIENRHDEIVVVKLVGGTNAYVRRPFLYSGCWYGACGGLLAWTMIWVGVKWLSGSAGVLAALYQSNFLLRGLGSSGFFWLIIGGGLLGWLGAWLAVDRHLSNTEPEQ